MNSAQRLLRIVVVVLMGIMVLFPPYLAHNDSQQARWVSYGSLWQPPYPPKDDLRPAQPYCSDSRITGMLLLLQLALTWMVSSAVYARLGKLAWDPEKYPEYYRP